MKALTKLQKSKVAALSGLLLILGLIVLTMVMHAPWWALICLFFLFMSDFTHLGALFTEGMNPAASRQLERVSLVCGVAGVVSLIAECVVMAAL